MISKDEESLPARRTSCVIFDRNGGVWAFRSYDDAEGWIEAIDVVDGEYFGFDSEGYVLAFDVIQPDVVVISRTDDRAEERAADKIQSAMSLSGAPLRSRSLPEMIDELLLMEARKGFFDRIIQKLRNRRAN
ncbi:hypothetical protein [Micromonospora thermarum]|uniref:Uncharacterized protein n=1 Tax=Micromonospora thermarum TaxID=2720024 RepID=A0ABX0ZDB5_9ACTN|nr:hypothetical protein [Micromonospora thermarum]NJP35921.1 hypothetical protein [Micromonospora thermarum]